jgi:hypothetical protein
MKLDTLVEVVAIIAIPAWLVINRLKQIRIELLRLNSREEVKGTESENRRERAHEALKRAVQELSDPHFKEMDHALGTGHGYRRAERIVNAKSFDEIERIDNGDDVPTELDSMDYWDAVAEQESTGSLFKDPTPRRERVQFDREVSDVLEQTRSLETAGSLTKRRNES